METWELQVLVVPFSFFSFSILACGIAAGCMTTCVVNSIANCCDSTWSASRMCRNLILGERIRIQMQFRGGRAANVRHLRCLNMQRNISGTVTLILLHSPFFLSRAVPYIRVTRLMNRAHLTPCLVSDSAENCAEKWQHCITRSATAAITLFTAKGNVLWKGK